MPAWFNGPGGLDAHHDNETGVPTNRYSIRVGVDPRGTDIRVQQATMNLFADMDVQPATLQPGLVPATKSTDAQAPISKITAPADGASVTGAVITITGTATDTGGGVVSGVEVSVDGGTRWHPATGRDSWRYEWKVPAGVTKATILSRATDDSANLETPGRGVTVTLHSAPVSR